MSRLAVLLLVWTAPVAADDERSLGSTPPGGTPPGGASPGAASPGHQRMVAALEAIRQASPQQNVYVGDAKARHLRRQVAQAANRTAQEQAQLRLELGNAELRLGREHEAIRQLQRALALLPALETADQKLALEIRFRLGVAYLRLGETANCAAHHSAESCILPLRGAAIHQQREGSSAAIQQFADILQRTQVDSAAYLRSQWLLNLAFMTLGEYPDGVPERYRIPADSFRSDEPFPRFENVAAKHGLNTFSLAGGAIAEDFDGDGDLDLVVSTSDPGERLRFFRNRGADGFEEDGDSLEGLFGGLNVVHADYDNDGDADVLVLRGGWMFQAGEQPNSLLQNQGDGRFVDVTFAAGLGKVHYPTQTAAWADYDNDGDLDVYIGNESFEGVRFPSQLFENRGDGTFEDVARSAGVDQAAMTKAVVWGDYDGDRYPDLYVSNFGQPNRLYRNNRDGTFTDVAAALEVDGPKDSFPAWFWDYDNDGHLDLFVSSYKSTAADMAAAYSERLRQADSLPRLYRGGGSGSLSQTTANLRRTSAPMGCNFGDLDGDGFLDFYLGTGWPDYEALMPNLVFRNRAGTGFADVTTAAGLGHLQKGHAVVFADFDNDGDQDIFQQMGGFYRGDRFFDVLYANPGFGNHHLTVILQGTRSNRSAIGARLHLVVGDGDDARSLYRHVNSGATFGGNPLRRYFGLGPAKTIERLEVFWPTTGKTQTFTDLALNRTLRITEGGEGYELVELERFALGD
ncbi:MAG: FG-GAP-like repeat-containing protein [Acidobacteriota bacterium]